MAPICISCTCVVFHCDPEKQKFTYSIMSKVIDCSIPRQHFTTNQTDRETEMPLKKRYTLHKQERIVCFG